MIKYYPLVDEKFKHKNCMAVKTGEKRKPLKGEWFISGAIPEAYKAPNDLSQEYFIAKIVEVEKVQTIIPRVR